MPKKTGKKGNKNRNTVPKISSKNNNLNKIIATIIVVALAVFVLYAIKPFASALLGAGVLYVLFKPLFNYFKLKAGLPYTLAALTVMLISFLIFVIPLFIVLAMSVSEVSQVVTAVQQSNIQSNEFIVKVQEHINSYNIKGPMMEVASKFAAFAQKVIVSAATKVTDFIVSAFTAYFVLFFLLTNQEIVQKYAREMIPFNANNQERLMFEFSKITKATVYSTGVIAVIQGSLLGIMFHLLGIPSALFWGVVGTALSFIPVMGTFMIWFPAAVIYAVLGSWNVVILLLVGGVFIGMIDNFIRPGLNKRFGEINPIISVLGIFSGLLMFGMIGLLLGPLLLSYFFLILRMFKEEYL